MNNISYIKEIEDSRKLAQLIIEDDWIDSNTIIVNCSPDYSSIVCQVVNHELSKVNNNELFDTLTLQMPYPIMSQVWSEYSFEYENFDYYLSSWVNRVDKSYKYLFIDSATIRGKNFLKLRNAINSRMSAKLASLYIEESSIVIPDYYIEKFSKENGELIFEWENSLNPNWK